MQEEGHDKAYQGGVLRGVGKRVIRGGTERGREWREEVLKEVSADVLSVALRIGRHKMLRQESVKRVERGGFARGPRGLPRGLRSLFVATGPY